MAPKSSQKTKQVTNKFTIDATGPTNDKVFDIREFETFLNNRIKVEGKTGNLGEIVKITREGEGKIVVIAHTQFSGRYLKYLTKKFLKKHQLRDWLRVISTSKGVYELKFYNVVMNQDEDEDDE